MSEDVKIATDLSEKQSVTVDTVSDVSQLRDSLTPIIKTGFHLSRVSELTITIEWWKPPRVPNPTEYEWNTCPATFRCYSCLDRKGRSRHFGGLVLDKRICRECYPYADEALVGGLIRFDMKHGFKVD